MTANPAPEVDFVLTAIDTDWPGSESSLSEVPLERVDRDNSDLMDSTPVHQHSVELQETNLVGAATATRDDTPLGTEYDLRTERTVDVKVEGAHVSEMGAIDPQAGTADAVNRNYPTTTWDDLIENVRLAILQADNRTYPTVSGRTNVGFKDLFVENWDNQASSFSDYYLLTFSVRFSGFEDLPD